MKKLCAILIMFALLLTNASFANDGYRAEIQKAATQGDATAQYSLGVMYYKGEGVRQDYAKAGEWFEKAATQGDATAQYNLGFMYYAGKGYAKAWEWYEKAATQGNAAAQYNLGCMYG